MDRVETYEGGFEVKIQCEGDHWLVTVSCHDEQICQLPIYGLSNVDRVGLAIINAYLKGTIAFGRDQLRKWQAEDEEEEDEDLQ